MILLTCVRPRFVSALSCLMAVVLLAGCAAPELRDLPPAPEVTSEYLIGPGDTLQVFVWRNPEVSITVPVRPDGKISTPLVEDLPVTGKTPNQVAREVEKRLAAFLKDPLVTVIVTGFQSTFDQQIRVLGAATRPQALRYFSNMTVLDVLITVGGLTPLAAGNSATITRRVGEKEQQFTVRLSDLIRNGDMSANVKMAPGDILVIPESWF
jgi:polysaccharide export outer membrane protein